jgi:hypothetical protein
MPEKNSEEIKNLNQLITEFYQKKEKDFPILISSPLPVPFGNWGICPTHGFFAPSFDAKRGQPI